MHFIYHKASSYFFFYIVYCIALVILPLQKINAFNESNYELKSGESFMIDSDGDGIDDSVDLDDDNDGIIDENETRCIGSLSDFSFYGNVVDRTSNDTMYLLGNAGWASSYSNETMSLPIYLEFMGDVSRPRMFGLQPVDEIEKIDNWTDSSYKVYLNANNHLYGKLPYGWNFIFEDYKDKLVTIEIAKTGELIVTVDGKVMFSDFAAITDYKFVVNSYNGGTINDIKFSYYKPSCNGQDVDTDQDGIPNRLDLDSDGDLCVDAFEGNGNFNLGEMDANGRLLGGVDMDPASLSYGVPLIASTIGQGVGESVIKQNLSPDRRDCMCIASLNPIDSDNDGECDNIDYCPTIPINQIGTPCNDGDSMTSNDKWDSKTCSCVGTTICQAGDTDTDGDGICDKLDMDDDNDGIPDTEESICASLSLVDLDMYGNALDSAGDTELFLSSNSTWRTSYSNNIFSLPLHLEYRADFEQLSMIGFLPVGFAERSLDWRDSAYKLYNHTNGRLYGKMPGIWSFHQGSFDGMLVELDIDQNGNLSVKMEGHEVYSAKVPVTDYRFALSGHSGGSLSGVVIRHSDFACVNFDTDTNEDGIPNRIDLDSDGDDCVDAFEGSADFTISDMDSDGRLLGGVDTNSTSQNYGIPLVAQDGQGDGLSKVENQVIPDSRQCLCMLSQYATDTDGDGICDQADLCATMDDTLIGTACNDNDACTVNDVWTVNCDCQGERLDSDGDSICDSMDVCIDYDDEIDLDQDDISDCVDTCIDVDEDDLCDDVDSTILANGLDIYTSHRRGFYSQAFDQHLLSNDPSAVLYYTLDGSQPTTSSQVYSGNPIPISETTILRVIGQNAQETTESITHSFIFLEDVVQDPALKSQIMNQPQWGNRLKEALMAIPSISLVSDSTVNEFTKVSGSMEMLFADSDENFQSNCGIDNYGNASLNLAKRNIRMYFDNIYGPSNLNQNIFEGFSNGIAAADKFDKLDLRSSHESWLYNAAEFHRGETYMTTKLLDDLMLRGGTPNPHNRFVHVYIDGKYWGQYDLREKFDDNMLAEYLGGDSQDYNFISGSKVTVSAFYPIDGIMKDSINNDWQVLVDASHNYLTWKTMVDENSMFDLMLIFMYGFAEAEWNAVGAPSNGKEFVFQSNDADLFFSRGFPLWTNRTYPQHNANGPNNMFRNLVNEGHPDFITDFADRASLLLDYDGLLTPSTLRAHIDEIAQMIEVSIIGEAARWSEEGSENPLEWQQKIDSFKAGLVEVRRDVVVSQMKKTGIYPMLDPLDFSVAEGLVQANSSVALINPNSSGTIYYTLDGTDPRLPGGAVSPTALSYQNPIVIPQGATQINARIKGQQTTFPETNIAINKPISVSRQSGTNSLSVANDGEIWGINTEQQTANVINNGTGNPWLEIDLGTIQQIDKVRMWERGEVSLNPDAVNPNVFVSDVPFTSELASELIVDPAVQTFTYNGIVADVFELDINTQGRYVRVMFDQITLFFCSEFEIIQVDQNNPVTTEIWSPLVPQEYFTPQDYQDLVINEIHYNPNDEILFNPLTGTTDTISGRSFEFVELKNNGDQAIHILGTRFSKGIQLEIEDLLIVQPNSFVVFAEDEFWFEQKYGFAPDGQYSGKLDNGGEKINYKDPFDAIIDSLQYNDRGDWPGTADKGLYSVALLNSSLDNALPASWAIQTVFTTPRAENYFTDFGDHGFSGIVINEIHYNPFDSIDTSVTPNETINGRKFEFVEIKNVTTASINLTNVEFTRGISYAFPPGTVILPNDFIVLAEDKSSFEDRYGFAPFDKYDGKLDNEGEVLWLQKITSTGPIMLDAVNYSSSFPWDAQANGGAVDYSLALIDGKVDNNTRLNWRVQCTSLYTPGAENDFDCFTGYDYTGLKINEIFYGPSAGSNYEFIEITNHSNVPMDLEGVSLATGIFYSFDAQYLPGTTASPNNSIVIARDSISFHNTYGFAPAGTYIGVLSNSGERLMLQDLFGNLIDELTYDDALPWDPVADQGVKSLALISGDLDNSLASSWCIQDVDVSPMAVNTFGDADNDSVLDCQDQCPGQDDGDVGQACDDGDPCTIGETYNTICQCTGGVFQDADNDGVCNANDQCPGQDDMIDINNNGIPDGCEVCIDEVLELSHQLIVADTSANHRIKTNGLITTGKDIEYNAGQSIELLADFEVEMGAVFHAYISPCQ